MATASAAGVAVVAVAPVAWAAETGNHRDENGNLANTEYDIHCTAKIQAGFHPPATGFGGALLVTYGQGNCTQQTTFDHGIVDIQQAVNGDWVSVGVPGNFTTTLQWTLGYAIGAGDAGPCTQYRARTRVWRRADADKPNNPTIAVRSPSIYIGTGGICDKL